MAKFTSLDGIDAAGQRAEVVVQTGTGVISEINPRGKTPPGSEPRNVEVVFQPDNPKLVRKVYGMLDTTASELWAYIKQAHSSQANVSFRIESQRRRSVDRGTPFKELNHSEDVIRVIAAIDDVFSHEALTNPSEDPNGKAPSALHSPTPTTAGTTPTATGEANVGELIAAVATARSEGLPQGLIDALSAQAVAHGAGLDAVLSAGLTAQPEHRRPESRSARAMEERPWTLFNSDGRVNPGSYWVAHVASAHRFACDYLREHHTDIDIRSAEGMSIIQTFMEHVLTIADQVSSEVIATSVDRQKNSYNRVLSVVFAEVSARVDAPVAEQDTTWDAWVQAIIDVAVLSLTQILHVAEAWLGEDMTPPVSVNSPTPIGAEKNKDSRKVLPPFQAAAFPNPDSAAFQVPTVPTVERLKALCERAQVAKHPKAVANWLEACTGQRSARNIHQPVLEALVNHYEAAGSDVVKAEVTRTLLSAPAV